MWDWFKVEQRTNNRLEGWHCAFNKRAQVAHPVLFRFLELVRDQINSSLNDMVQKTKGERTRKNIVYAKVDKQLQSIMDTIDKRGHVDYLGSIHHAMLESKALAASEEICINEGVVGESSVIPSAVLPPSAVPVSNVASSGAWGSPAAKRPRLDSWDDGLRPLTPPGLWDLDGQRFMPYEGNFQKTWLCILC